MIYSLYVSGKLAVCCVFRNKITIHTGKRNFLSFSYRRPAYLPSPIFSFFFFVDCGGSHETNNDRGKGCFLLLYFHAVPATRRKSNKSIKKHCLPLGTTRTTRGPPMGIFGSPFFAYFFDRKCVERIKTLGRENEYFTQRRVGA